MTARRIAANPIPYWSRAGKTREVFEEAFRDFQEIGFTAVKKDCARCTIRTSAGSSRRGMR
jgi:hypothetical protein